MQELATAKMTPPLEYFERLKYDTPERRHFMVISGAVIALVILLNLLPDGDGVVSSSPKEGTASIQTAATTKIGSPDFMNDPLVDSMMRAEALAESERMASYQRFVKSGAAGGAEADLVMSFEGTRAYLEEVLRKNPKLAPCRYLLVKYLVQGSYAGAGQFAQDSLLRAGQELRMAMEASNAIEKKAWCLRLFIELQSFLVQADNPASKELLELLDKNSN